MSAPHIQVQIQKVPVPIVGGTHFGRYPKISKEATWNFIVSDNWLVPYAGYKEKLTLSEIQFGRAIYSSFNDEAMYAVIGNILYRITASATVTGGLVSEAVGTLFSSNGDVFIAENNNGEICITDGVHVYVYNYSTTPPSFQYSVPSGSVSGVSFDFPFSSPGYVSFALGQLIIASTDTTNWVLSDFNNALVWSNAPASVGSLQAKPDTCQAVVPMPGAISNVLVFGKTVTEMWQNVGNALFPYQRNNSFNIDYGCLNSSTIAHLKNYVVWLAVNEQSGPVIMVFNGSSFESISTDGIDFQMGNLVDPQNCTAFLYQQDGHVIYQFTFPTDNISYAYDFNTKLFSNVSDENLNYHIAREVAYFNGDYYFVSLNDGKVFNFDSIIPFAQYNEDDIRSIPRIRITTPLRLPTQRWFIMKNLYFTIENGQPNQIRNVTITSNEFNPIATESGLDIATEDGDAICIEATNDERTIAYASEQINLAISRDGGVTFGSFLSQDMNPTGHYISMLNFQRLGHANDATFQIRFNGYSRFSCTNGEIEIYG